MKVYLYFLLIWARTVDSYYHKHWHSRFGFVWMSMLIWAFVIRICTYENGCRKNLPSRHVNFKNVALTSMQRHYFYSELAAALRVAPCGKGRRPARTRSMVQHTYVSLPSNQTGNKHFVRSLSGSQLMWQICLYLPGQIGKIRHQNPVPKF